MKRVNQIGVEIGIENRILMLQRACEDLNKIREIVSDLERCQKLRTAFLRRRKPVSIATAYHHLTP